MEEFKNGSVKFDLHELIEIVTFVGDAARFYRQSDSKLLAKDAIEFEKKLYDICKKHGFYEP